MATNKELQTQIELLNEQLAVLMHDQQDDRPVKPKTNGKKYLYASVIGYNSRNMEIVGTTKNAQGVKLYKVVDIRKGKKVKRHVNSDRMIWWGNGKVYATFHTTAKERDAVLAKAKAKKA